MPEYSIDFAQEMSKASNAIVANGIESTDAQRATLYIGLVACEIAIKAALECAGMPISKIKACGHNLSVLLDYLSKCTVLDESQTRVSAVRIRASVVDNNYIDATIGKLLDGEYIGASQFPNQIRYGDELLNHFPAHVIAKLSEKVVAWVKLHMDEIKV